MAGDRERRQRRGGVPAPVSYAVQLAPFDREQTGEMVRRRIATSTATINFMLKRAAKDL